MRRLISSVLFFKLVESTLRSNRTKSKANVPIIRELQYLYADAYDNDGQKIEYIFYPYDRDFAANTVDGARREFILFDESSYNNATLYHVNFLTTFAAKNGTKEKPVKSVHFLRVDEKGVSEEFKARLNSKYFGNVASVMAPSKDTKKPAVRKDIEEELKALEKFSTLKPCRGLEADIRGKYRGSVKGKFTLILDVSDEGARWDLQDSKIIRSDVKHIHYHAVCDSIMALVSFEPRLDRDQPEQRYKMILSPVRSTHDYSLYDEERVPLLTESIALQPKCTAFEQHLKYEQVEFTWDVYLSKEYNVATIAPAEVKEPVPVKESKRMDDIGKDYTDNDGSVEKGRLTKNPRGHDKAWKKMKEHDYKKLPQDESDAKDTGSDTVGDDEDASDNRTAK
ncbi:hypothetical protein FOL47_002155 [Perkinsus chesapeaki]|uniref:Uncharacterized protein n=1 Tax=Perkinsus chesapeaki TaxID=330153 RepID=A0A7J6KPU1_PERCH|nr:hypothetical protein FOL47_002155 [Perkinsus chesapeaki]